MGIVYKAWDTSLERFVSPQDHPSIDEVEQITTRAGASRF